MKEEKPSFQEHNESKPQAELAKGSKRIQGTQGVIREIRGRMQQKQLAKLLDISPSLISLWEYGKRRPSLDQLQRMFKITGITEEERNSYLERLGIQIDSTLEFSTEDEFLINIHGRLESIRQMQSALAKQMLDIEGTIGQWRLSKLLQNKGN